MRLMSFSMTVDQVKAKTKTVTRRMGWDHLKPGDVLCAVEKGMGLKKGEKVVRLATIRIVSVRPEPLKRLLEDRDYGFKECEKEGFGAHPDLQWPTEFVEFFCASHKGCTPESSLTRIEFEYLD